MKERSVPCTVNDVVLLVRVHGTVQLNLDRGEDTALHSQLIKDIGTTSRRDMGNKNNKVPGPGVFVILKCRHPSPRQKIRHDPYFGEHLVQYSTG